MKQLGLGPGAKQRISVPGTDSEHHTQRFGAGSPGRKTGKETHIHWDEKQVSELGSLPVGMIPVAPVKDIARGFRYLEAKATWPQKTDALHQCPGSTSAMILAQWEGITMYC